MRAASAPPGLPPPFLRQLQKNVWFHACAALLKTFGSLPALSLTICYSGMSA